VTIGWNHENGKWWENQATEVKNQISSSRTKGWKLKTNTLQQTLRPAVYPIWGVRPRPFSSAALLAAAAADLAGLIAAADVDSKRKKKAHKGAFPAMSREKCVPRRCKCCGVQQVRWLYIGNWPVLRQESVHEFRIPRSRTPWPAEANILWVLRSIRGCKLYRQGLIGGCLLLLKSS
jgi:hypothetical protein